MVKGESKENEIVLPKGWLPVGKIHVVTKSEYLTTAREC